MGEYQLELEDGTIAKSSREFTGKAKATYPLRGETYTGDFKDGVRHGNGKYTYGHGDVYEGEFRENLKHGIGKLIYRQKGETEEDPTIEKGVYHGYFESGVRHGEGVFMYPNGNVYSGYWKDGKKHGKGVFVFLEEKMKFKGEWAEGSMISGTWEFHNGVHFRGGFENNKPQGEGVWVFPNGNVANGNYKQTLIPKEEADLEEGEEDKPDVELAWTSFRNFYESASAVNLVI